MSATSRWWKKVDRLLRIAKREASKASEDVMLYGTGAIYTDEKGESRHIPLSELGGME
jgi:hypothetical protein